MKFKGTQREKDVNLIGNLTCLKKPGVSRDSGEIAWNESRFNNLFAFKSGNKKHKFIVIAT